MVRTADVATSQQPWVGIAYLSVSLLFVYSAAHIAAAAAAAAAELQTAYVTPCHVRNVMILFYELKQGNQVIVAVMNACRCFWAHALS